MTYKINQSIRIIYQALGGQTGMTDLTAYIYNPSGTLFTTIGLSEILSGLYSNTFTPNAIGRWNVRITSATYPQNTSAEFYYVANENYFPASIITDGSIERLAVDVNSENGIALQRFTPSFIYSVANTALSDVSYTTLFELTGSQGKLAFINLACTKPDYTIRLSIDGVIKLTISMSDLGTSLGLSSSVGTSIPIYTSIANKNFVYNPLVPVDFNTGFKVEAIKTIPQTTTINWLITYRTTL